MAKKLLPILVKYLQGELFTWAIVRLTGVKSQSSGG